MTTIRGTVGQISYGQATTLATPFPTGRMNRSGKTITWLFNQGRPADRPALPNATGTGIRLRERRVTVARDPDRPDRREG